MKRVLVLEGFKACRDYQTIIIGVIIRDYLSHNGYQVDIQENERLAIDSLARGEVDAAILDFGVSELRDKMLIEEIRNRDGAVPKMFLLNSPLRASENDTRAQDWLWVKPVNLITIKLMVHLLTNNELNDRDKLLEDMGTATDEYWGESEHTHRVAELCSKLCYSLGYSETSIRICHEFAYLHDLYGNPIIDNTEIPIQEFLRTALWKLKEELDYPLPRKNKVHYFQEYQSHKEQADSGEEKVEKIMALCDSYDYFLNVLGKEDEKIIKNYLYEHYDEKLVEILTTPSV